MLFLLLSNYCSEFACLFVRFELDYSHLLISSPTARALESLSRYARQCPAALHLYLRVRTPGQRPPTAFFGGHHPHPPPSFTQPIQYSTYTHCAPPTLPNTTAPLNKRAKAFFQCYSVILSITNFLNSTKK